MKCGICSTTFTPVRGQLPAHWVATWCSSYTGLLCPRHQAAAKKFKMCLSKDSLPVGVIPYASQIREEADIDELVTKLQPLVMREIDNGKKKSEEDIVCQLFSNGTARRVKRLSSEELEKKKGSRLVTSFRSVSRIRKSEACNDWDNDLVGYAFNRMKKAIRQLHNCSIREYCWLPREYSNSRAIGWDVYLPEEGAERHAKRSR